MRHGVEGHDRFLCYLHEIPQGQAKGLWRDGGQDLVFAVRKEEQLFIWVNSCPHNYRPLEYRQDQFLSGNGEHIICYAHSAHFNIEDGSCFSGPCFGKRLLPVSYRLGLDGSIWVSHRLPTMINEI